MPGFNLLRQLCDSFIDTGMDTECQPVTGGINFLRQFRQGIALVTDHMQHRTENFPRQFRNIIQFNQRRRDKGAVKNRR
ncbi:Uncharacterised protein [Klebsiella pneumoniae]|nr:Uncharacterised protein [Klebsiella pneumoniae]